MGEAVRAGGEFYSKVIGQERQGHLVLTELRQATGRTLPRHEHELAYVTIVLDGQYAEGWRRGFTDLPPFTAIFNPPGVLHAAVVGAEGTRLFTIEWGRAFLEQLGVELPGEPVVDPGPGTMLCPGLRVLAAFRGLAVDPLILESHVVEMLGNLSGVKQDRAMAPTWLLRVRDRLNAEFRDGLRVFDLAAEAGVHPVHLTRVFRRREGQTVGDYVQRLRVRAACQLLRRENASLAEVAAECGFADQPHFNRVFKKVVGLSPGRFRNAFRRTMAAAADGSASGIWGARPRLPAKSVSGLPLPDLS